MENNEAVDLLERSIASLPDPDFGVINLMPFAVDSEQTNALKRKVCEAIVRVFRDAGYQMERNLAPAEPSREVRVSCMTCSSLLFDAVVGESGGVSVPASHFIASMARLNPACPHQPLTPEDQRRMIEEAVRGAQGDSDE